MMKPRATGRLPYILFLLATASRANATASDSGDGLEAFVYLSKPAPARPSSPPLTRKVKSGKGTYGKGKSYVESSDENGYNSYIMPGGINEIKRFCKYHGKKRDRKNCEHCFDYKLKLGCYSESIGKSHADSCEKKGYYDIQCRNETGELETACRPAASTRRPAPRDSPSTQPTPAPKPHPRLPGYGCNKFQDKNLGTSFASPEACLQEALEDDDCTGLEVMWSPYSYSWGCRCCSPKPTGQTDQEAYTPNPNWNVWAFSPDLTPSSTKNSETEAPSSPPTPNPTMSPTTAPSSPPTPNPTRETKRPTPSPSIPPPTAPTRPLTPNPTRRTKRPTPFPTMPPTPKPTNAPPTSPTTAPTNPPTPNPTRRTKRPTPFPTMPPTPRPTSAPTTSPTTAPTNPPTPDPTRRTKRPTPIPTMSPSPRPTNAPTTSPTTAPTKPPTPNPTRKTKRPTPFPASAESPRTLPPADLQRSEPTSLFDSQSGVATKLREVGKGCSADIECDSNTCRSGVCMASPVCYPLKHEYGRPFDTNMVNLVFVGSAFNTTKRMEWHDQVNTTYNFMRQYKMFASEVEQLSVFFVDPINLSPSFCAFNCAGIQRLLCCDGDLAGRLSNKCFPDGGNVQTLVIHNDNQYGGAGYTSQNIATMSIHPAGAQVAVHELGHSLFELGDEYSYGPANADYANCSPTDKCEKWSDLMEDTPDGYRPVKCIPGCRNNEFYVGVESYMRELSYPVGAVNERYTCCTYMALTKSIPLYCKAFDPVQGSLFNFCSTNDYQGYGQLAYGESSGDSDRSLAEKTYVLKEQMNSNFMEVSHPVLVKVGLSHGGVGDARILKKPTPLPRGLYRTRRVLGDYSSLKDAARKGVDRVVRLKAYYEPGGIEYLFFSTNCTIEVPPENDGVASRISKQADTLKLALDTQRRELVRVKARFFNTPWENV